MFTEIDGRYDDVAISTFKARLSAEHDLRKSPLVNLLLVCACWWIGLINIGGLKRISYRVKGKRRRSLKRGGISGRIRHRTIDLGEFAGQSGSTNAQAVNVVFWEPVQKVLEKVRNESFFKWPNKMAGDPVNRNQNLYCHYHRDHGHTTEDCRNLWDHLEQLVWEGRLKHLLHHSSDWGG